MDLDRRGDRRAGALLAAAGALLTAEAEDIRDAALRENYLSRIAEHREIVALE